MYSETSAQRDAVVACPGANRGLLRGYRVRVDMGNINPILFRAARLPNHSSRRSESRDGRRLCMDIVAALVDSHSSSNRNSQSTKADRLARSLARSFARSFVPKPRYWQNMSPFGVVAVKTPRSLAQWPFVGYLRLRRSVRRRQPGHYSAFSRTRLSLGGLQPGLGGGRARVLRWLLYDVGRFPNQPIWLARRPIMLHDWGLKAGRLLVSRP